MSQPEEQPKAPEAGTMFYTVGDEEEDEGAEEHEIDEVLEYNTDAHSWNVSSGSDFYDIVWNEQTNRWEEV